MYNDYRPVHEQRFFDLTKSKPDMQDLFMCGHCNKFVEVRPFQDAADAGGFCDRCARVVCARCAARKKCDPWEERLVRSEARATALKSYGLGG